MPLPGTSAGRTESVDCSACTGADTESWLRCIQGLAPCAENAWILVDSLTIHELSFFKNPQQRHLCNFGGNSELFPDSHTTRAAFWVRIGRDQIHTGVQHTHQWPRNWFEDAAGSSRIRRQCTEGWNSLAYLIQHKRLHDARRSIKECCKDLQNPPQKIH